MYLLKQIKPTEWHSCQEIIDFYHDLPKNPYCTNEKGGCYIRSKKQAFTHSYIQPNHPAVAEWLVFDVDYEQALFAYHDRNAPRPQLIIRNPRNGHAHYCYKLTEKVGLWGKSSAKAVNYLKAIYGALQRKLGADSGYSGNLVKNPAHSDWLTYTTGAKKSYTLGDLSEWLDLSKPKKDIVNDDGYYLGRNHEVFERTRHQAYPLVEKYSYDALYNEILAIAMNENERFRYPLGYRELKQIAKSITRFCQSPRFGAYSVEFLEKQRRQGRNGALVANSRGASSKGGKARSDKYEKQRHQARELRLQGLSIRRIAEQLQVSKNSVEKWVKS